MKARNNVIVGLIFVAVVLLGVVEFIVVPHNNAKREQSRQDQHDPLTHHVEGIIRFKNPYMGDASNLSNLFANLPLSRLGITFQLYPEELTAEIIIQEDAGAVDELMLKRSLIYNSTAAFALIDNLEALVYRFTDMTYTVNRSTVAEQYRDFGNILEPELWSAQVQQPLQVESYVQDTAATILNSD